MDDSHIYLGLKNIGTNESLFIKSKNSKLTPLIEHAMHASLNTPVVTLRKVVTRRETQRYFGGGLFMFSFLHLVHGCIQFIKTYQVMYL